MCDIFLDQLSSLVRGNQLITHIRNHHNKGWQTHPSGSAAAHPYDTNQAPCTRDCKLSTNVNHGVTFISQQVSFATPLAFHMANIIQIIDNYIPG